MENKDVWIHDIQAGELINLKNLKAIWIHKDKEKSEVQEAQFGLYLDYYSKGNSEFYLWYDSREQLYNAFEHYKQLLKCKDLDVSQKPISL